MEIAMPKPPPPRALQPALPRDDAEPTDAQLTAAAGTFALLASPPRLHLVWLITRGSYDVGTLAKRVGVSIATVSQHLSKLRLAGVITARREGRHHIYAVDDPHIVTMVEQIFHHIAPDGSLAPDPPLPAPTETA
jgi:DNA-binding transcriptional ArsR family regulator